MIAALTGTSTVVGLDRVVITVGGVGLLVHTTPRTAAEMQPGGEVTLATTLVVREESLTLFGFGDTNERDMFETVQTVSGVGPRLALAMLAVLTPDEVRSAITTGDVVTLTKVPGVGKKSAERLVLELKDKIGMPSASAPVATSAQVPESGSSQVEQVTEALVGLGWNPKQASGAIAAVSEGADVDAPVSTLLRLALRELSR